MVHRRSGNRRGYVPESCDYLFQYLVLLYYLYPGFRKQVNPSPCVQGPGLGHGRPFHGEALTSTTRYYSGRNLNSAPRQSSTFTEGCGYVLVDSYSERTRRKLAAIATQEPLGIATCKYRYVTYETRYPFKFENQYSPSEVPATG